MIIVLKNADFSQSNIGTLSTWRISRSLGVGATYDGPTSVDKGASFTATVTIAEGYEIGSAGVTVTMGGAGQTYTINGNVITISIAAVTGNIVIKVPTVNLSTGEEEEPDVPDTPDGPSDDGGIKTYTITSSDIESGGWGWYDKMDNDKRLRTKELIPVPAGSVITVDIPSTLKLCVTVVKKDNSSTSANTCVVRDLWTTKKSFNVTEDGYLHLVWAKQTDTQTISVSDWGGTYTYQA